MWLPGVCALLWDLLRGRNNGTFRGVERDPSDSYFFFEKKKKGKRGVTVTFGPLFGFMQIKPRSIEMKLVSH